MSEEIECLKEMVDWFENGKLTHSIFFECRECDAENYLEESFDDVETPTCIVDAKRLIQLDKEKK